MVRRKVSCTYALFIILPIIFIVGCSNRYRGSISPTGMIATPSSTDSKSFGSIIPTVAPTNKINQDELSATLSYMSIETASDLILVEEWNNATAYDVAWSPDSRLFAMTLLEEDQYRVVVLEAESIKQLWEAGSPGPITDIEFSPDGRVLAVLHCCGHPLQMFDTRSGEKVFEYSDKHYICSPHGRELFFTPDSDYLYWTNSYGRSEDYRTGIYRMEMPDGNCEIYIEYIQGWLDDLHFLKGGNLVITSMSHTSKYTREDWVYIWDAVGRSLLCQFKGLSPIASPKRNAFLLLPPDGNNMIIDGANCEVVKDVGPISEIIAIDKTENLILQNDSSNLVINDFMSLDVVNRIPFPEIFIDLVISPDWKKIIIYSHLEVPVIQLYYGQGINE